jgi:hypothetical protein
MKYPHAWNWDRKGGRNMCYRHNQQNRVHEHPCKEMGKFVKTCSNATSAICGVKPEHSKLKLYGNQSVPSYRSSL